MSEKITIPAQANHVDQRTAQLTFFRKERGETKTDNGYMIPLTTYGDVEQMVKWWDREFLRAVSKDLWDTDPARTLWVKAKRKVSKDAKDAKPDAVYPDNSWFWNEVILKLSIYLEGAKTKPSSTDLLVQSFKETIGDRIDDAGDVIEGIGDAIETVKDAAGAVVDVGESAWSGIKIAAIVGGSLVGAAIVLPPVIRAVRQTKNT